MCSAGAWDVDTHFRDAPFEENIPVQLGLASIWNVSFLGYPARAILPYTQALSKLAPHIQQASSMCPILFLASMVLAAVGEWFTVMMPCSGAIEASNCHALLPESVHSWLPDTHRCSYWESQQ